MAKARSCDDLGKWARKRRPQARERGTLRVGEVGRKLGKRPLRASGLILRRIFVGCFRHPQAAFAAAEGLQFRETVRSWNGPRKAQGAAATRASGVKHGIVVRRLH